MRCCVCDYSPQTPSLFENSLVKGSSRNLRVDKRTQRVYCEACLDVVNDTIYTDQQPRSEGFEISETPMLDSEFTEKG